MSDPQQPASVPPPSAAVHGETTEYRPPEKHHVEEHPTGKRLAILTLTALGVVYGDIGTSPLYAIREVLQARVRHRADAENVYGILSLILWSLILVVSVKYIVFIMRADNRGEGGILAMLAMLLQQMTEKTWRRVRAVALGLFGAALLYGDGMITPAMSVLSAMEGLIVVSDNFAPLVVPLSVVILVVLFVSHSAWHGRASA
jgi:KUP system potassium uptake protein